MDIPQCGNLEIFHANLILREILAYFRRCKTAILTILEAENFDLWKHVTLEMTKIPNNSNSELLKYSKWQFVEVHNDQN